MADYRTDEEQIEILKRWWQENGRSMLVGVAVALAGYLAWAGWHGHKQSRIETAADIYQQIMFLENEPDGLVRSAELAEQLRKDHADSVYAVFAALHLAKNAVVAGDLARASEMLGWVRQQKHDDSMDALVSLRLAQVQYAQGQHDDALKTLAAIVSPGVWRASVLELRGDVQLAQGNVDAARASYAEAIKSLDAAGASEARNTLEMKLDNLALPASLAGTGGNS